MLSGSDARMARKYGRMWQAAGVTCYANGIRVGIAEHELFGTPPQRVAVQPDPAVGVSVAVYEFGDWPPDEVNALVAALKAEGIPFAWDEKNALHVSSKYEASVNALIEEQGGTP